MVVAVALLSIGCTRGAALACGDEPIEVGIELDATAFDGVVETCASADEVYADEVDADFDGTIGGRGSYSCNDASVLGLYPDPESYVLRFDYRIQVQLDETSFRGMGGSLELGTETTPCPAMPTIYAVTYDAAGDVTVTTKPLVS